MKGTCKFFFISMCVVYYIIICQQHERLKKTKQNKNSNMWYVYFVSGEVFSKPEKKCF